MGPLVYTSGRRSTKRMARSMGGRLQWGRWFTPAVGSEREAKLMAFNKASMGPLVYTSGRLKADSGLTVAMTRFNGAAGLHQR